MNPRVYADQVNLLYYNQSIGMAASVLNGMLMIAVLWNFVPRTFLISWGLLLITISILRIVALSIKRAKSRDDEARKWGRIFVAGLLCAGLIWGSLGLCLFYTKSIELHLLIAFVLGGMVAGAAGTFSALRSAFYAFAIPALLPLTISFFYLADLDDILMGTMILIYMVFLSLSALTMHRVIRRSFQLRYEKDDLISRLELSKAETESAVDILRKEVQKRRDTEKELRLLSSDLERQVHLRTQELELRNQELDAFTYSVSHDLQGPVRAMDGYAKMLMKDYSGKMDSEFGRKFDVIRENAKLMGDLIEGLLKLSRIGRKEISLSQLDMKDLFEKVWHELKSANPERHLELIEDKILPACGDKALIRQVFYNLASNALKFTQYEEKPLIKTGSYSEDGRIVYYIQDNGAGFDMQYYDRLFSVFQRLHSASQYRGTGIGLAIVQRIITRHGGRVWAEGKVGKGATFYFSLPNR